MADKAFGRLIGIVGPCAAGKSTLVSNLNQIGFSTRHIAQEHSYVPDMWARLTHPDMLIFLDVSFEISTLRGQLDWSHDDYNEQRRRLNHALTNADLYIDTNSLTPDEVLQIALDKIDSVGISPK